MTNYKIQFRELTKGVKELINPENLEKKLFYSEKESVPLKVKLGADPTANSLHIGHMVPVHKLKQFQDYGHQAIFLMGDFTARIGDPSGKSSKRVNLAKDEVHKYMQDYLSQIFKVLDSNKTNVEYNSSWFEKMNVYNFITDIAQKSTVAQLLVRDDFNTRYTKQSPIAISEFLYPLLQAYDSVALETDVEIGGNDQLFNFMAAREMQKQFKQEPQTIMTLPTIRGLDGHEKMSKSIGNTININDKADDIYGKIMSVSDDIMKEYYEILSLKNRESIESIKSEKIHPKKAKEALAKELVALYYNEETANLASQKFDMKHVRKETPENLETVMLKHEKDISVIDLAFSSGLANSKGEIRRAIKQNGLRINGDTVFDLNKTYSSGEYVVNIGKKRFAKVVIENNE